MKRISAILILAMGACSTAITGGVPASQASRAQAILALDELKIPDANDVRGNITLPAMTGKLPGMSIRWKSSNAEIVSDEARGELAAGVVTRPRPGAAPARVTLDACITAADGAVCRTFVLTIRPAVQLAPYTRYAMFNFARSNSQQGQQIYAAASVGNDPTQWVAVNGGKALLESTLGMHGVRDPSIVRSPEGDKFYLIATDLNVDATAHGWRGWDWAQTDASRYIEVWESTDLHTWSAQRHVLVAPEEAGMTFAPEAIWDPSIGAYVVYWTSSMYPHGTHFSSDRNDANRRFPVTRNQTLYATTRDFVTFTPPQVMSGRPGHGTLDAVMIRDEEQGIYYRFVSDRISTGVGVTRYAADCPSEDIYQERAASVRAAPDQWTLVATCLTHRTMKTTYAEAPMIVEANGGDSRGKGYYLWADQKWAGSPAGKPMEEQLSPYWSASLASGTWAPVKWKTPDYDLALGVIRHGHVSAITQAEHASLRGAALVSLVVAGPGRTTYRKGESLDLSALHVTASYSDGVTGETIVPGYGGYVVIGYDANTVGSQTPAVCFAVGETRKCASFTVTVQDP